MKVMTVSVCLLVFCLGAWSQSPVSVGGDKEIEKLISKVEGVAKKPVIENLYQPGSDREVKVSACAETYFTALAEGELSKTYAMMTDDYKKWVAESDYLKKNRLALSKVQIKTIVFEGEHNARVQGYLWGAHAGLGSDLKIPFREHIVFEGGEWRVYRHPFSNAAGMMPPMAKKIKKPSAY